MTKKQTDFQKFIKKAKKNTVAGTKHIIEETKKGWKVVKPYAEGVGRYSEATAQTISQEVKPTQRFNPNAVNAQLPIITLKNLQKAEVEIRNFMSYGPVSLGVLQNIAAKYNLPFIEVEQMALSLRKRMGGRQPSNQGSGFGFGGF
jgi:hypothetical protein